MLNCREVTQQDLLGPVLEVVNLIKVCLYELQPRAELVLRVKPNL